MYFIYLILAFTLNGVANVLLKIGAKNSNLLPGAGIIQSLLSNYYLGGGIVLFAANVIFYILALRSIPLSTAYPIMVVASFLIVNGFAFFYFKEQISPWQVAGYILILAGILLVVSYSKIVN